MSQSVIEPLQATGIPGTSLIRGVGEMADRIRAHAWSGTALGGIDQWPAELLAFVNMMLSSREVMTIFWGPDRLMIYNDGYVQQLGSRHPVLGRPLREVWPEVVDQVEPLMEPAFREGKSSYLDNTALTVLEDGKETKRFYTAAFEPIWVRTNASIVVQGVFQTAINNTASMEAQRQLDSRRRRPKKLKWPASARRTNWLWLSTRPIWVVGFTIPTSRWWAGTSVWQNSSALRNGRGRQSFGSARYIQRINRG